MARDMRPWIFLATLLFGADLSGQPFFKILGTLNEDEHGQCVQATPDGNYVIGGAKSDSALIVKVDPTGQVIWSRCFNPIPGIENVIHHISVTPDGYLIGVGNATIPGQLRGKTFLFKFDLAGNMIWQNRSVDSRDQWSHRILPMGTNQYMLFSGIWDLGRSTWADVYTAQVDANTGQLAPNLLFLDMHPSASYCEEIHAACQMASGAMYSTGRVYMTGALNTGMRAFLSRYNAAGGHQWTKYLMFSTQQSARIYGADVAQTGDSLILAYYGDISGASSNYSVGLVRMDTLGQVAWSKDYRIPGASSMMSYSVLPMPYGYAITGNYTIGLNSMRLFVIAVDGQGNVLWATSYGNTNVPIGLEKWHSAQAIRDGSDILFTGTRHGAASLDIILARVDATGNAGCDVATSIASSLVVTTIPPFTGSTTPNELTGAVPFVPPPAVSSTSFMEPCPMLPLNLGPDIQTCDSMLLDAFIPGATYAWSTGSQASSIVAGGPGTYYVEVTMDCCLLTDTIHLLPDSVPAPSFHAGSLPCDLAVTFSNTSSGASQFTWDFGDGGTSNQPNPTHSYSGFGNYLVTLIAQGTCGSDTLQQDLLLAAPEDLYVLGPQDRVCPSMPVPLQVTYNGSDGLAAILWSTGDTTASITVAPLADTLITVNATSNDGCTLQTSYLLNVIPEQPVELRMPNVFSPNHDGRNDSFSPNLPPGLIRLSVFNRWGNLIFETTNAEKPWLGDHNGKPVPDGTYLYIVRWHDTCAQRDREQTGHVTLLR